jgi:methylmalonyl-CoA mutase
LPTHRGYDSDHILACAEVGMAGVAIDSVEDMKRLLANIPLDKTSISMTMNGAVLPILAAFIVAAEESGVSAEKLTGTIQNDILKEFMVRNTYIFAPKPSMRVATDIVEYVANNMPRFNAMSISGYHFQEAGADPIVELALTLANGREYAKHAIDRGLNIDFFCEKLSFFFGIGSDFYLEIAKLRAARVLWCEITENLGATSSKAKALRMHCQTSGWSLTAQSPMNNVARATMQSMAAVFGGTQSLHTNSYDEAISLPSEAASRMARNTQLIMQHETGICDVIDPWAGSYMMESLTSDVVKKVKSIIDEIDEQGGIITALESGWINQHIQTNAAITQANIDSGEHTIIGLNKHIQAENQGATDYLNIDSHKIRKQQIERLTQLKSNRDQLAVKRALNALTSTAKNPNGNLLEATIKAIKVRATIGECIEALEKVYQRHTKLPLHVSGFYKDTMKNNNAWKESTERVRDLTIELKRKPRILIAKLGQDGHDRGANIIASALSDVGFDIYQAPMFQSIPDIVNEAVQCNVDIIGISSLVGTHLELIPKLISVLDKHSKKFHVVVGGVIPEEHFKMLEAHGVALVFKSGDSISAISNELVNLFEIKGYERSRAKFTIQNSVMAILTNCA